jgi:hypothetical protein
VLFVFRIFRLIPKARSEGLFISLELDDNGLYLFCITLPSISITPDGSLSMIGPISASSCLCLRISLVFGVSNEDEDKELYLGGGGIEEEGIEDEGMDEGMEELVADFISIT